jgi:hypothetical protein
MGPRQKNRASERSRRAPIQNHNTATPTPPPPREKRKQIAVGCGSSITQHTHSTAVPQHDIVHTPFVIMLRYGYSGEFMLNNRQI